MLFPFFSFCFGSLSNFVTTEWTPEEQADQTPKSLGLIMFKRHLLKHAREDSGMLREMILSKILSQEVPYEIVQRNGFTFNQHVYCDHGRKQKAGD